MTTRIRRTRLTAKQALAKLPDPIKPLSISDMVERSKSPGPHLVHQSTAIGAALQDIKATAGRNDKYDKLKALEGYPFAAEVMRLIFDVYTTFGIKKMPKPYVNKKDAGRAPGSFTIGTMQMLRDLADRKLTGNTALDFVAHELGRLDADSQFLLTCIIQKNCRAGFSGDVANRVWPGLVKIVKIQLAEEFDDAIAKGKLKFPCWGDVKYDGVRGFRLSSENRGFFSRAGLPLEIPDSLEELLKQFMVECSEKFYGGAPILLDCEIVPLEGGFKDIMSNVRSSKRGASEGSTGIRIIDIITEAEYLRKMSDHGHGIRRADLELMVEESWFRKYMDFMALTEGREIKDEADAREFFGEQLGRGLEGAVFKQPDALWEGKRTFGWVKLKAKGVTDGVIIGYKEGEPGSKWEGKLGALRVRLTENGVEVNVAGMTDKMRRYLLENIRDLVANEVEAEVKFHEWTPDGSLRHPRIHIVRDDK